MSEKSESLSKWFSKPERPKWLQFAADRLFRQYEFTRDDVSDFVTLCQQEADEELSETPPPFPTTAFSRGKAVTLRLCAIKDVKGINALAPKKSLEFGESESESESESKSKSKSNITIVYGDNGSGKSGYVRLLKHVCGARDPGILEPNVYKSGSTEKKACISFEKDGKPGTHTWSGQGVCDDLKSVDIFDTSCGKAFVSNPEEVSYEPPELPFFSKLIRLCDDVKASLKTKESQYQFEKLSIPDDDKKKTPEWMWYEKISFKTKTQDIDEYCAFSSADEKTMQDLQQRFVEQDPAEKAKKLRKRKGHIDTLVQDAQKYLEQLSDENCRRIMAVKENSDLKKKAADAAAEKVFSGSKLEGIGSKIWKELWEAARNYSVSKAYKEAEYPNVAVGSRCVLCHQTLAEEAKKRLRSFEKFVKDETQKTASDASKKHKAAIQTIETLALPTPETLKPRIDAADIPQDEFASQVIDFFTQLQARKDLLRGSNPEKAILVPLPSLKWVEEANAQSKSLGELAAKNDEDAQSADQEATKAAIKKELDSLQTRQWLSERRTAICEEVKKLKRLNQIREAKKLTNTTALSRKENELAEVLLTEEFVQSFNAELKALCKLSAFQVEVELVKLPGSKDRVRYRLQLRNAFRKNPVGILSEGEDRIVSIAAFLADVTFNSNQAPFIFDDPISSLDQDFEEAVVQRLCSIASERQVIIFTHRLSLLVMIQDYAKKVRIEPKVVYISKEPWGTGEPGDTPLQAQEPMKALKTLIKELPEAKRLFEESGFSAYKQKANDMCIEFRIILERMIEFELMSDIVQRYRRAIYTNGKISKLAKISEADCKLFDDLMTDYSRYLHSQPLGGAQVRPPRPDKLEKNFNELKQWHTKFEARSIKPGPHEAS